MGLLLPVYQVFGDQKPVVLTPTVFTSPTEELPKKVDSITPYTMALIAKYIARHRLREMRLLDTIADFLVKKAEYLDSKVRTAVCSGGF